MANYFKIPSTPISVNKSVRFPEKMVEEIEEIIKGKECSFSAFVVEAVRVALTSLNEEN